ncbi:FmdB family zinc ribbon protein [Brachybacterium hainanense]|uniref:FmdB family zinc ribbon protein n=1 Tax=Brachybacterium hainanense TaxID=1541174 RepID=A0ABV6RHL6_9MICO
MPTYVYACKSCGHQFEKYQSFSEDSLVTCPECSTDALRKVFNSVGIVFKGSGFYSTDSSAGSSTASAASEAGASSSTPDAGGKISAPAAPASPAPATAAPAAAAS